MSSTKPDDGSGGRQRLSNEGAMRSITPTSSPLCQAWQALLLHHCHCRRSEILRARPDAIRVGQRGVTLEPKVVGNQLCASSAAPGGSSLHKESCFRKIHCTHYCYCGI